MGRPAPGAQSQLAVAHSRWAGVGCAFPDSLRNNLENPSVFPSFARGVTAALLHARLHKLEVVLSRRGNCNELPQQHAGNSSRRKESTRRFFTLNFSWSRANLQFGTTQRRTVHARWHDELCGAIVRRIEHTVLAFDENIWSGTQHSTESSVDGSTIYGAIRKPCGEFAHFSVSMFHRFLNERSFRSSASSQEEIDLRNRRDANIRSFKWFLSLPHRFDGYYLDSLVLFLDTTGAASAGDGNRVCAA